MVELKNKNGPAVNLEVLDRLVHEYMLEEELIDEEGPTTRPDAPSAVSTLSSKLLPDLHERCNVCQETRASEHNNLSVSSHLTVASKGIWLASRIGLIPA